MITRWEEIAQRTADKLGLSLDVVKNAVQDMAVKTAAHLSHPTLMETDLLGIGALEIRYGKAEKRIPFIHRIITVKKYYAERCRKRGFPEDIVKAEVFESEVKVLEQDILFLQEMIDLKKRIYDARGRKSYLKELLGEDVKQKDLITRKKKVNLSGLWIGGTSGKKKGAKDTKPRKRKKIVT